jgi:hypothetical protein
MSDISHLACAIDGCVPFDIEALAPAAKAAAEALPAPTSHRQRVVFGRIPSLAMKTSEQASASLRFANAQVTALTTQTQGTPEGGGAPSTPDRRTNRADARRGR